MISNNKNKNSKELTLEEIIHKSKFRKNIDNICSLQTKINKDLSKPASLANTPITTFNKSSEISKFQHFESKRSIQSTHEPHRKVGNSVTARTTQSYKQPISECYLPHQTHHNNFKTIKRDEFPTKQFKKSKQNHLLSLEKTNSLKSKPKKINQFLCVKGASGNVVINTVKPMTAAQGPSRDLIPEYEMKKYQTVVELGSQLEDKQKLRQLKFSNETIESKKYHSFMVSKYTTSNNLRQRAVKSKSYSQSKLKNKIMLPDDLIKKKIEYRGIKTEEKINSKVENAEDMAQSKSKNMKKYELILNINFQEELRKQSKHHKIKNQLNSKNDEYFFQKPKETFPQLIQQELMVQKVQNEQSPNQTNTKGFKGKKAKSTIQMKTRYFIPDFIKPSLDLLVFDKKKNDKLKTQEIQTLKKHYEIYQEQTINKTFQQIAQGIHGKQINTNQKSSQNYLNPKPLPYEQHQNPSPQENQLQLNSQNPKSQHLSIQNQEETTIYEIQQQRKNKKSKSKPKPKKKVKNFQDGQICAWNQSNHKNTPLYKELLYDLDF